MINYQFNPFRTIQYIPLQTGFLCNYAHNRELICIILLTKTTKTTNQFETCPVGITDSGIQKVRDLSTPLAEI